MWQWEGPAPRHRSTSASSLRRNCDCEPGPALGCGTTGSRSHCRSKGLSVFTHRPVREMNAVTRVAFGLIRAVPGGRRRGNDQHASQRSDDTLHSAHSHTLTHTQSHTLVSMLSGSLNATGGWAVSLDASAVPSALMRQWARIKNMLRRHLFICLTRVFLAQSNLVPRTEGLQSLSDLSRPPGKVLEENARKKGSQNLSGVKQRYPPRKSLRGHLDVLIFTLKRRPSSAQTAASVLISVASLGAAFAFAPLLFLFPPPCVRLRPFSS